MSATVKWDGGVSFKATSGTGHTVMMDGPEAKGGQNKGARPMELLLMGMGGCSSFDVLSILQKSRQEVSACEVEVQGERADEVPAVYTAINLHFIVTGKGLKEALVKRAVSLSAEKYCSASIMMERAGATVTHSYEIIEG